MKDGNGQLERYLAGEMTDAERREFESEVLASDALSDELYADVNTVAAVETAAEAHRLRRAQAAGRPGWMRWPGLRWAVPTAAVAVLALVFVVRGPSDPESPPVFRGVHDRIEPLTPRGAIDAPPRRFSWTSRAASVRFELYDTESTRLFSVVTAETTLVLPPEVAIPDRGYWILTPLDDLHMPAGEPVRTWYETRR